MECPIITGTQSMREILKTFTTLPYNQRNYVWTDTNIIQHIKDIYSKYINNAEYNFLGSAIYLKKTLAKEHSAISDTEYEIWDGQQRLFTTYLILCALYKKYGNATGYLRQHILYDISHIKKRMISHKQSRSIIKINSGLSLAKFHTVHEADMDAIKNILSGKYMSLYEWLDPNDSVLGQKTKIKCKCGNSYMGKNNIDAINNFKKHCEKVHNYMANITSNDNSNIYVAYELIMKYLHSFQFMADGHDDDIHNFISYILDKTGINVQETTSKSLASEMFDRCNNRGVPVDEMEVMKNYLIAIVDDCNSEKYFNIWNRKYKEYNNSKKYNIYGNKFVNNLVRSSIYTLLNKVDDVSTLSDLFTAYIATYGSSESVIDDLFSKCDTNIKHIQTIMASKYGGVIYPTKRTESIALDIDILCSIVLPLFNKFDDFKSHALILEIITRTHIRACIVHNNGPHFLTYQNMTTLPYINSVLQSNKPLNIEEFCNHIYNNIYTDNKWGDVYFGKSLKDMPIDKANKADIKKITTILRFYEASTRLENTIAIDDSMVISILDAEDAMETSIGNYLLIDKRRKDLYASISYIEKIKYSSNESVYITRAICKDFLRKKTLDSHAFIALNNSTIVHDVKKFTNIKGLHYRSEK